MEKVTVHVNRPYDVVIGEEILNTCGAYLRDYSVSGKVAVITDENVAPLYLEKVKKGLQDAGYGVEAMAIPAGEQSKTMSTLQEILSFLADKQFGREDTVVALGGGVVGDISGFAAGIYMRGIAYVQIPTTLLAAVDSSVGGKTAVDLPEGKNLAGLFVHPKLVITDICCFRTLPKEVLRQGMAEVIKTAVLSGEELFSTLETEDFQKESIREKVVKECVAYKAKVVEADFTEKGERKLLNLGHTPAHAIEKASGYEIPHGDAVALGLRLITAGACGTGLLQEETGRRIIGLINEENFPEESGYTIEELARTAAYDKKRQGDTVTMILPHGIGDCRLQKMSFVEVFELYKNAKRWLNES